MESLENIWGERDSAITRDLKLNLKRLLTESSLTQEESLGAFLALGVALGEREWTAWAAKGLVALGFSEDKVLEVKESAAIMAMLNTYYRFRKFIGDTESPHRDTEYKVAGLRMQSLAQPQIGKTQFEMLAFALSVLNGCSQCVGAHEKTLRDHQVDAKKIHDLARLASIAKAVKTWKHANEI